ncbi:hypothetical protein [Paenibacillus sp. Soil724D2]|nr:hypothetical protein [Paenibacillus sp. Soil724D2]
MKVSKDLPEKDDRPVGEDLRISRYQPKPVILTTDLRKEPVTLLH